MAVPVYYISSDHHAGDKGPRDNFCVNGRIERFNKYLDWTVSQGAKNIILGDLFDFWQMNYSSTVVAYKDLLDRLYELKVEYVIGNHDNILCEFIGKDEFPPPHPFLKPCRPFIINKNLVGGKCITLLHGHEADKYCNDVNPNLGNINTIIAGMLEDKNKGAFNKYGAVEDEFIGNMENMLGLWQKMTFHPDRRNQMINNIEDYRKAQFADVVIYGHTHEAGNIGDYHYNTGTWARDKDTFAEIMSDGKVNLYEWTKDCKPVLFQKPLMESNEKE